MLGNVIDVDAAKPLASENVNRFATNATVAVLDAANIEAVKIFQLDDGNAKCGSSGDLNFDGPALVFLEQIIDGANPRSGPGLFLENFTATLIAPVFSLCAGNSLAPHAAPERKW